MAAWTSIPDSDLDPESPITTSLMIALRDNPIAIAEAASGAPDIVLNAVNDNIRFKIIEIGDWDMDFTTTVNVAHGLTMANIRHISVTIISDAGNLFDLINGAANADIAGSWQVTPASPNVNLTRNDPGFFNSTSFDATSFNRGWVTIIYAA